jgi:TolB-like protein/DNA-binding winged helix-turn-helix (wHTH) protein/Flp pilus assembly protein TadD
MTDAMVGGGEDLRGAGFQLHDWTVEPGLNRLTRGGEVVHLRPKVMDVLVFLAGRAGEVVSKGEITEAVWAKKFLADTALGRAVFELRAALGDDPQKPTYVETIPKRGYRVSATVVRRAPVSGAADPDAMPGREPFGGRRGFSRTWAVALALIFLGAVGRSGHHSAVAAPVPAKRIAVLPFENLGNPEDAFLATGLAEEIASRLAKVKGVAVIARSSAERLVGTGRSDREIGEALEAEYVLRGAVRWDRAGTHSDRVRITPSLVRVSDGAQVWASAFDGTIRDVLRVQSDVATSVIAGLGVKLTGCDRERLQKPPTTNPAAHEAFLRGLHHATNLYQPEQELRLGLQMYRRAVELDPGFVQAWSSLSILQSGMFHFGYERSDEFRAEAKSAADRALELDPESSAGHASMGFYLYWCEGELQRALDEFAAMRREHGASPWLGAAEGYVLRRLGRWDEALATFARAQTLDPMDPSATRERGLTALCMRRYEEAEQQFRYAIGLEPDQASAYEFLASTYWLWRGDTREARATLESIPRPSDPWLAYWWFWEEIFEGKFQAALDRVEGSRLGVITTSVVTNSRTWDSRELMLGRAYSLLGRTSEATRAYEEARVEIERLLAAGHGDFALQSAYGLALAGVGRNAEAVAAGRKAVELMPLTKDALGGTGPIFALAEIQTAVGDFDGACRALGTLVSTPGGVSVPFLELDPRWAPLRQRACFAALAAGRRR